MAQRDDIQLELRSDPRLLRAVRALVRSYVTSVGFSRERADDVVLAVDEACANSIRHAYEGRDDGIVSLSLRSNAAGIEIELHDHGRPAEADRIRKRPPEPPDPATLRPGGLGVQLIYSVFDEVAFHPGEHEGNCVTMRLHRPQRQDA